MARLLYSRYRLKVLLARQWCNLPAPRQRLCPDGRTGCFDQILLFVRWCWLCNYEQIRGLNSPSRQDSVSVAQQRRAWSWRAGELADATSISTRSQLALYPKNIRRNIAFHRPVRQYQLAHMKIPSLHRISNGYPGFARTAVVLFQRA
jgi:hypothetical protein